MNNNMSSVPPPVTSEITKTHGSASAWVARVLASAALGGLAGLLYLGARHAHLTLTDAYVAPAQLSPDNDRVVDLRIRRTKEHADRARLVAELAATDEEIRESDLGLLRLQRLGKDYEDSLTWSRREQSVEVGDLSEQVRRLTSERELLIKLKGDQERNVQRTSKNLEAGLVTQMDVERESTALRQLDVGLESCELELSRARATLNGAESRNYALTGATPRRPSGAATSPDVAKFYESEVRIELEISHLEGERRAARARQQATLGVIAEMDDMLHELESRPLYRAMNKDTDIAFAPYEQLKALAVGDKVYACKWLMIACRAVGTVAEVVPGEVITPDPWGEMARGQYIVLAMTDRSALVERVLRVRHEGGSRPAAAPGENSGLPTASR